MLDLKKQNSTQLVIGFPFLLVRYTKSFQPSKQKTASEFRTQQYCGWQVTDLSLGTTTIDVPFRRYSVVYCCQVRRDAQRFTASTNRRIRSLAALAEYMTNFIGFAPY